MSTNLEHFENFGHAWTRRTVMVFAGQHDTHISTGEDYETRSLGSLFTLDPTDRSKAAGMAFIPSSYCDHDGREHRAQRERGVYVALTGDVDKGDHSIGRIETLVRAFAGDSAWLIYSSAHARPAGRRWRVIMPLDEPADFDTWHDAQDAFYHFMESAGITMDWALDRAAQPVYLPNVPPRHDKTGEPLRGERGETLYYERISSGTSAPGLKTDAGALGAGLAAIARQRAIDDKERERIRVEAERKRANRPKTDNTAVIDDLNESTSVETLLELYHYQRSPRHSEDWRSPHQQGQSFATRVIGRKWVSLSASDVSAGIGERHAAGCYGDAYDLLVHYEHGGDHKAAFRALHAERKAAQGGADSGKSRSGPAEAGTREKMSSGNGADPHEQHEPPNLLPLIDFSRWIGKSPPDRLFAWGDMIPLMTTTMLTGPGGVGKSLFEQMLCTCISLGAPFLGQDTRQMNTLYVTCEDDEDELWRRQTWICAALGISIEEIIGKLHLVSLCGIDGTALATFDENEQLHATTRWRELEHTCEARDIQLYAFDNATDAMAGDLNSIHQVAEFVNLLTGLAIRRGGVAMILHHPNKAGDDWLGSVAWHNKVRSRLIIKRSENAGDDDGRVLENPKANYGPSGGKIDFRWFKGAFVRDEDLPPSVAEQLSITIRASSANECFLACLAKTLEEGRNVSHAPSAGNYAPRLFAKMTIARGHPEKDFEEAMERLLHLGKIRANAKVFQYETNRTWAVGLKVAGEGGDSPIDSAQSLHKTSQGTTAQNMHEGARRSDEKADKS